MEYVGWADAAHAEVVVRGDLDSLVVPGFLARRRRRRGGDARQPVGRREPTRSRRSSDSGVRSTSVGWPTRMFRSPTSDARSAGRPQRRDEVLDARCRQRRRRRPGGGRCPAARSRVTRVPGSLQGCGEAVGPGRWDGVIGVAVHQQHRQVRARGATWSSGLAACQVSGSSVGAAVERAARRRRRTPGGRTARPCRPRRRSGRAGSGSPPGSGHRRAPPARRAGPRRSARPRRPDRRSRLRRPPWPLPRRRRRRRPRSARGRSPLAPRSGRSWSRRGARPPPVARRAGSCRWGRPTATRRQARGPPTGRPSTRPRRRGRNASATSWKDGLGDGLTARGRATAEELEAQPATTTMSTTSPATRRTRVDDSARHELSPRTAIGSTTEGSARVSPLRRPLVRSHRRHPRHPRPRSAGRSLPPAPPGLDSPCDRAVRAAVIDVRGAHQVLWTHRGPRPPRPRASRPGRSTASSDRTARARRRRCASCSACCVPTPVSRTAARR